MTADYSTLDVEETVQFWWDTQEWCQVFTDDNGDDWDWNPVINRVRRRIDGMLLPWSEFMEDYSYREPGRPNWVQVRQETRRAKTHRTKTDY